MKILLLKFRNINSLSGETTIDFTNPVFINDGLFAITGKTGAGKSTILDAISLALYGKTPRVDITGDENAVMTRGEKDCFSEIVFEISDKKWKASWKQEKTRTGSLKPVNRQIADYDNKIIADQVRICNAEIIKIIGLTFEQFTKVIMLAQGSFAAFLQADKNDKGELLEQITGTEIYGEISKKVYVRNRIERDKFDKILIEIGAIKIFSEEEINRYNNEIEDLAKNKEQIDSELKKLESAQNWLINLAELQKQINETSERLPELEEQAKTAEKEFEKSDQNLQSLREEHKKLSPIFLQTRELDIKISERVNSLRPILKSISELEKVKSDLSQIIDNQKRELKDSENLILVKKEWSTQNKRYEDLVANYTAIEQENQLLSELLNEINREKNDISRLSKELEEKELILQQAHNVLVEKNKIFNAKTEELNVNRAELIQTLRGKELGFYQAEKESLTSLCVRIEELIITDSKINENHKVLTSYEKSIKQSEDIIGKLKTRISEHKDNLSTLSSQIVVLEENISLTKTVQSLVDLRQNLKDGMECPLCGSKEHPYAFGNIPQLGEKEIELSNLRGLQQNKISKNLQDELELARLEVSKNNDFKNKTSEEQTLNKNLINQEGLLNGIRNNYPDFSLPGLENRSENLNKILDQKRESLKDIEKTIECANSILYVIEILRDKEIPSLLDDKQEIEKSKNEAETNQKLAIQTLKISTDSLDKSQEKYEKESESFLRKLRTYDVENIYSLKRCLDKWNDNANDIQKLTDNIKSISSYIDLNSNDLKNQITSLEEKQHIKLQLEKDIQNFSEERFQIFADKSVEEEENNLRHLIGDSENSKTKAEKEKSETISTLQSNNAILNKCKKDFLEKQNQNITDKTSDVIKKEYEEMREKADEFLQKIGAIKQALKSNNDNLESGGEKLKEKEKQIEICNKWGTLNDLIGSLDGKKYRNFAQSLTFEHLIGLSNIQLHKMSDRYILKPTSDANNPFELSVIDRYHDSEERTVQNLSGGEKFIVSLSLALGLANMTSKNMPIDTMFIDEGFGTLDSDYLDVALNALSNLQSEGKIIGIISHLSEIKERIATHIEVIPIGNGHSKIQITN